MSVANEHAENERQQFAVTQSVPCAQPCIHDVRTDSGDMSRLSIHRLTSFLRAIFAALQHAIQRDRAYGNGFLFIPVFLAVGSISYFAAPWEPGLLWLLAACLISAAMVLLLSAHQSWRAILVYILVIFVGALAAKVQTWRIDTAMFGSEITTTLTGRVITLEHQSSGRVRLTLEVLATRRPELRHVPKRIRANVRNLAEDVRPGDLVQGVVRLMPPSGPLRPQSYDFAFKSFFDGIGANGFFMSKVSLVKDGTLPTVRQRLGAQIEDWRLRMAQHISETIGGPEGAIAAALITGIRAGIPEEINEALRISGIYHVISISGLHMALVGGTIMLTVRAACALSPSFSMRRPAKKFAAFAALLATGFYLFISGADIAAQRSFIMLAVMLVAVLFDRSALTMRNLAISAIILLLIAPHEVVGPSFQMSFAATAALVAAYGAFRERRAGQVRRAKVRRGPLVEFCKTLIRYAAGLSITSIIAGSATALFTAWHFQQVSPLGLVANLAAMPFVSVIVMPMAVLASLLMPFGLDGLPLQLMGLGITAMNSVAFWTAERSAYDSTGAISLASVLVLTAALALLTMSSSAVRWLCVPMLVVGSVFLLSQDLPDVLISEDGRLVAVRQLDGRLAVNRARPQSFVLDNWQRAVSSTAVLRPRADATLPASNDGFTCNEGLCIARAADQIVAHAQDDRIAASACAFAHVLIVDDATAVNPCADSVVVITKRDLARRGSAEIRFRQTAAWPHLPERSGKTGIELRYSISEPYRVWHAHRQFSREARGLAPWRRSSRASLPSDPIIPSDMASLN